MTINLRKAFCEWVNALVLQAQLATLPPGCENLQ